MPISPSLDLQILFPCMGHARRGSRKRPDPPPGHVTAGSVGNGFRRLELTMRAGSNQPSAPPWPRVGGALALTAFSRQSAVEVHLLDKLAGRELKAASLIAKWRVPKEMPIVAGGSKAVVG
jgi:hypothetical protein